MRNVWVCFLLLCLFGKALGDSVIGESWECRSAYDKPDSPVLVSVRWDENGMPYKSAEVNVSGTVQRAYYRLSGLDRRWDFGEPAGTYALTIQTDGRAAYYDFSGEKKSAPPSQTFRCRMTDKRMGDWSAAEILGGKPMPEQGVGND